MIVSSLPIGILGGTFDPIHCGHLDVGSAAQRALGLTRMVVIPSSTPPHREPAVASGYHRFAMAAMAIAGQPGWSVSDMELQSDATSYTATTLQKLVDDGYRSADLYFVIGADAFAEIAAWRDYPRILDRAHFVVVSRPGWPVQRLAERLPDLAPRMHHAPIETHGRTPMIILIDAPTADVSSTAIRSRRLAGESIAGLVDPRVQQHIEQHGLYSTTVMDFGATDAPQVPPAGRLHG
ncbi:MAG TPA: nicotinate-nucleotide adenylyltransferase [Vicinamibacterales bacterium]|jgi:nicotinate-nucleotide adenylyltransferase